MHTNIPNHEPSLLMMNCGDTQPVRPSMGSWLVYGLGTENQNLPGFVVMCPGHAGRRAGAVEQQLPARHLPGRHINNSQHRPAPRAAQSRQRLPRPRPPSASSST